MGSSSFLLDSGGWAKIVELHAADGRVHAQPMKHAGIHREQMHAKSM